MKYGSVCSGIEAASVAWHDLGWKPAFFSEIEKYPREVLAHHFPDVPLHGDFTTIEKNDYEQIDLLVGGTPCQDFSIAGLREGIAGDRGNLTLEFVRLAQRLQPRWIVWENVPGVLSSDGGRALGSFLGALAELGYGFAYRVLDAQYFGVAQRRRRVFVVGHLGGWQPAAAVLFERESLSRDTAPKRNKGQTPTSNLKGGLGGNGAVSTNRMVAFGEYADDGSASCLKQRDYKDATDLIVEHRFYENHANDSRVTEIDVCPTISARWGTGGGNVPFTQTGMAVRRLTPTECERLQGFPDKWTDIEPGGKPTPDSHRYKALGNSMAVPVMRWIGERIALVDMLT